MKARGLLLLLACLALMGGGMPRQNVFRLSGMVVRNEGRGNGGGAIALIEGKRVKDEQRFIKKFEEDPEMEILKGRFGPYISYQKANYRIPKTVTDPTILTLEDCKKIIAEAGEKPAAKKTTRKKKA